MADFNITGYENLIIGIIKQATIDYKKALLMLAKNPNNSGAADIKVQCEKFFLQRMEMYEPFVSVDGSYIVREMKKMVEDKIAEQKKRQKPKIKKAA